MNSIADHPLDTGPDGLPSRQSLAAALLRHVICHYSEDYFCASWLGNMEYSLWATIHPESGLEASSSTLPGNLETTLRQLADLAQGWWAWSDEEGCEVFVPIRDWLKRVEERRG